MTTKIEKELETLIEQKDTLDADLLESVRTKVAQLETPITEDKDEDEDSKEDEKEDKEDPDAQDEDPAVKIDNPINPELTADPAPEDGSDEDSDEDDEKKSSVAESVSALLGDEFSEDFKLKAVTIFEAAVKEQVSQIKKNLEEEYKSKTAAMKEDFDTKLVSETTRIEESLGEEINGYLQYMTEEWVRENELAAQAGFKAELVESFINGVKSVFEEHYIDMPEEKFDALSKLQEEKTSAESELSDTQSKLVEMTEQYNALMRENIIKESAKEFTALDYERFKVLTEDFAFEGEDNFRKKVDIVKKAFFEVKAEKQTQKEALTESFTGNPVIEDTGAQVVTETTAMNAYLKFLKK